MHKTLCGTPINDCCGGSVQTNSGPRKCHTTPQEAFNCHAKYLVKNGFKQLGSREFLSPEGVIRLLTKKSKFGAKLRPGKSSDKSSRRFVPKCPGKQAKSGTIVST